MANAKAMSPRQRKILQRGRVAGEVQSAGWRWQLADEIVTITVNSLIRRGWMKPQRHLDGSGVAVVTDRGLNALGKLT